MGELRNFSIARTVTAKTDPEACVPFAMNKIRLLDLFKKWWSTPSIRSTITSKETFHSPSALAMNNRKEAAMLSYYEGYEQCMRDHGIKVSE